MCGFTEWLTPCNGYSILFSAMVPPCAAQSGSAYNWSVSWPESRKVLRCLRNLEGVMASNSRRRDLAKGPT